MTTATEAAQLPAAGTKGDDDRGGAELDLGHEVTPKVSGATAPTPVPAATATNEAEEEGGKGGNGIPRSRMNEVVRQREAAQAEAAELRREVERLRAAQSSAASAAPAVAAASMAPAFDVQAAEEQFVQALMDGDVKAAAALRSKINAHIEDAAFSRFTEATSSQQAATQAEATVNQLLHAYPWLDEPEGEEALELIEASVAMKMSRGTPRHQALAEATNAIAPRFVPDGHPGKGLPVKPGAVDTRTQRADERGAADSLLQPAAVQAGMGNRATPAQVDAARLTDDEYMALPEAERKRLRGD